MTFTLVFTDVLYIHPNLPGFTVVHCFLYVPRSGRSDFKCSIPYCAIDDNWIAMKF